MENKSLFLLYKELLGFYPLKSMTYTAFLAEKIL
jgi:hypothetical protein